MNEPQQAFHKWIATPNGQSCLRFFELDTDLRHDLKIALAIAFMAGAKFGIDIAQADDYRAIDQVFENKT